VVEQPAWIAVTPKRATPNAAMLSEKPAITVLMPVRNGADKVAEAVETILGQTLHDFEFLIINDGSHDGTQAIVEEFARQDPRIRLVNQENMGLAATLNKGLGIARGKYVARQDHDDLSAPDRLEKQLAWMEANPDCVLLGTRAHIAVDRTPTGRAHDHPTSSALLKLDLLFDNPFVHSSVMLRRERVLELGGYCTDPSRQPPEDYELWARIARHARVANLPERLLLYREVAGSISRTGANPFQSRLVLLSAENLALTAGLPSVDRHCRDIAALIHRAPQDRSRWPDLAAMHAVLQRCFARLHSEAASEDERREFEMRCGFWTKSLRRHYFHQVLQPGWAQPMTAAGYRGARSVLRKIRSLARKVAR
jgi:hypothetical protein